jgi:hypothetical protein
MLTSFTRRTGSAGIVLALLTLLAGLLLGLPAGSAHAESAQPPRGESGYAITGLKATPATADYDHQTTTLTGTVEKIDQDTPRTRTPAAGQTVDLVYWYSTGSHYTPDGMEEPDHAFTPLGQATTDAQGHFRLPNALLTHRPYDSYRGTYAASPYTVQIYAMRRLDPAVYGSWGAYANTNVTCTASQTRLNVRYTVGPRVEGTREVTVDGYYERQDGRTWKPVTNPLGKPVVDVSYLPTRPEVHGGHSGTAPIDARGHFSLTFTATVNGMVHNTLLATVRHPFLELPTESFNSPPINVSSPDTDRPTPPGTTPTHQPTTPTASTPPANTPAATPSSNDPQALAATGTGTGTSTLLLGGAALAAAGAALVAAGRRRTRHR